MQKTTFVFIVLVFIAFQSVNAQSAADLAKAYYFEAATSFDKRDYRKALEYCQQVEDILGSSNARVEALRVKGHYELGNIEQAKQALDRFSSYDADEALSREVSAYMVKIAEAAKKEEKFIEQLAQGVKPDKYDYMWPFSEEGLARVGIGEHENTKMGFIDRTGREVIPLIYGYVNPFSEGLSRVYDINKRLPKMAFIDITGKQVTPFKYETGTQCFSEGLAAVRIGFGSEIRWGFIDKTGKEVIPLKYDKAEGFSNGRAKVRLNGKEFYIDKNGNEVK